MSYRKEELTEREGWKLSPTGCDKSGWCRISGKIGEVANFEHLLLPLFFCTLDQGGHRCSFERWDEEIYRTEHRKIGAEKVGKFTLLSSVNWRRFSYR